MKRVYSVGAWLVVEHGPAFCDQIMLALGIYRAGSSTCAVLGYTTVLVFLIYIKTIKKITLTSRCHDNLSGIAVRITSQLLPLLQIWSILVPQIQDGQYVNVLIINNFLCLRQLIEQNKTYDGITSCFFSSPIDNLNK